MLAGADPAMLLPLVIDALLNGSVKQTFPAIQKCDRQFRAILIAVLGRDGLGLGDAVQREDKTPGACG